MRVWVCGHSARRGASRRLVRLASRVPSAVYLPSAVSSRDATRQHWGCTVLYCTQLDCTIQYNSSSLNRARIELQRCHKSSGGTRVRFATRSRRAPARPIRFARPLAEANAAAAAAKSSRRPSPSPVALLIGRSSRRGDSTRLDSSLARHASRSSHDVPLASLTTGRLAITCFPSRQTADSATCRTACSLLYSTLLQST